MLAQHLECEVFLKCYVFIIILTHSLLYLTPVQTGFVECFYAVSRFKNFSVHPP